MGVVSQKHAVLRWVTHQDAIFSLLDDDARLLNALYDAFKFSPAGQDE